MIFSDFRPFIAFVANKGETAIEILRKVKVAFENLPLWLQPNVVAWNEANIGLENGSRAVAKATSSDSIRGYSIDLLFVDEAAFVENWEAFWPSTFNTLTSRESTKAVLVSTPKGLNHFHTTWQYAHKEGAKWNFFKPLKVSWESVPGRDEAWKQRTLAGINFDHHQFAQEHEVDFLGSSNTLLSGKKLKELIPDVPLMDEYGIKQYYKPEKGRIYALVADVAEGKGLDYSAFQIIDVTKQPFNQVCTFRSNLVTPVEFADIIYQMGKTYNEASVLVELNSVGGQVCQILHDDYEYDNLVHTESAGPAGKKVSGGFSAKKFEIGVRTTKTVKATGCSIMKMLIEQEQLIINDEATIEELSRFIRKGRSWEAEPGATDDLTMCLVLFAWLSDQKMFRELTDIDVLKRLRDRSEQQTLENLTPFAMINTGNGELEKRQLLGNNKHGWVLDNDPDKKVRIFF
jgi:Terminase-like family.